MPVTPAPTWSLRLRNCAASLSFASIACVAYVLSPHTLGLREQIIFPEIEYDKVDRVRGMEITIDTTARTDDHAATLLKLLGMPFRKD